jgi:hypothetical protein
MNHIFTASNRINHIFTATNRIYHRINHIYTASNRRNHIFTATNLKTKIFNVLQGKQYMTVVRWIIYSCLK